MDDKRNPIIYLIAGLLGAAALAASVVSLSRLMPKMMEGCMEKMKEEGVEPPECCGKPESLKTTRKKRKK